MGRDVDTHYGEGAELILASLLQNTTCHRPDSSTLMQTQASSLCQPCLAQVGGLEL